MTANPHRAAPHLDLDELYRRHARLVWRIAGALGVPPDQRDDVVHDVFLVAHRRAADVDMDRPITAWLFGVTRMIVSNRRRSFGRNARKLQVMPAPDPPADPERHHEAQRRIALVREFLSSLSVKNRVAFELIEIEGMSGPEVAEATGEHLQAIYSRLRAARRAFAAFVAGQEHV